MQWLASRFSRWHLWTALAIWLMFSGLTLWIVFHGLDKARDHPMTVAATMLGTILGPMTGAISRGFQSCCLEFSLSLLPYCLATLIAGAAVQVAVRPTSGWLVSIRVIAWLIGWFVWFGGGILSFGHALS